MGHPPHERLSIEGHETMNRKMLFVHVALMSIGLSYPAQATEEPKTATVHLRIVDAVGVLDLGVARVESFERKYGQVPSDDYSGRFYKNKATRIPYDFYELCARRETFRTACTEVDVSQPEVWVVLGLRLGNLGVGTSLVEGSISGVKSSESNLWVRLVGIYSGFSVDAKVDQSGKFQASGAVGKYVLVVMQNDRILHTQAISIPASGPILIDLAQSK